MKIVHVISYFQPQVGYQEYYLAKIQQSEGHTVTIITSDRYYPFPNYRESYIKILGRRVVGAGEFSEMNFKTVRLPIILEFRNILLLSNLKSTLLGLAPDLIICHGLEFPISWQVARIKDKYLRHSKLIFDSHSGSYYKEHDLRRKMYGLCWRITSKKLILKSSSKIIAVSMDCKQTLIDYFNIPGERINVVPLGVDTWSFKKDYGKRKRLRINYRIQDDEIVGIYSGKIAPFKGIIELLDALEHLFRDYRNFKFLFVGFPTDKHLVEKIKTLNPNRCFYSDALAANELSGYYSVADFAIWPDSVTVSHYEAMSCTLPIIVSNLKVSQERVRWNNGYQLKECSPEEIYSKIALFLEQPELMKEMGNIARNVVEKYFSWETINRIFLEINELPITFK